MRGKINANENDRRFTKKPVPALVDPILQMRDRMTGQATTPPGIQNREPSFVPVVRSKNGKN